MGKFKAADEKNNNFLERNGAVEPRRDGGERPNGKTVLFD